jgi:outer membrane protein
VKLIHTARWAALVATAGLAAISMYAGQTPGQPQSPVSPPAAAVPPPAPAPSGALHLTLAEAGQLALKNNPRVAQSQHQARSYEDVTREFRAAYLPTVSGNITAVGADSGSRLAAGALNNSVVYNHLGTGVTLNQLVTDFGRTHSLVQSASLMSSAEQQAVNVTKADVILRTEAAYLAVLRARSLLSVARETVQTRQLVADQVSALFQNKLKSSLDLSFAKVNLADAQLLLSTARSDVQSAQAELARYLGLPSSTQFDLADTATAGQIPQSSDTLVQTALQKRPELLQQRLEVQSSQQYAHAERLLSRPAVELLGTAGYVPAGDPQIPGRFGAVGMNLNIPIFNGGLYKARRFEAEEKAAAAGKGLRDLELQISRDVRVAWLDATNAYERLGLTQQLLDQAKLALDLAQTRYKLGLSSIVELSQSQLQYTSAELARARARYDYDAQETILRYQAGLLP